MNKGLYKGLLPGLKTGVHQGLVGSLNEGLNNVQADRLNGFNPLDYGTMWGWWDAGRTESLTLIDSAGEKYCSEWRSLIQEPVSSLFIKFTQSTAAQRPIYRPVNETNKKPFLEFRTSSSQWMTNAVLAEWIVPPSLFIIVGVSRTIDATNRYLIGSRSSTERYIRTQRAGGTDNINYKAGAVAVTTVTELNEVRLGQVVVYVLSDINGDCYGRTNLNRKRSVTFSSAVSSNGWNLCSRFTGPNNPGNWDVFEILCYKQSLDENSYTRIFNYLRDKYKITL